jgi:cytochrome P450
MSTVAENLKGIADLPSPKGLPVLGNMFQLEIERFHLQLEKWCDELGPIFKLNMGPVQLVCVADPEPINKMLRDRPNTYRRRRALETIIAEMGFNGVFSSEGDDWRRQRKQVALALNTAHLHQFAPKLLATTETLRRRWTELAENGQSVDLCRDVMRYTVDITTQLAFGINANTLETDGPVIQQQLDKVFPMLARRINSAVPYWRYFRLAKDRELDEALLNIKQTVNGYIADCRQRMAEQPELFKAPSNFLEAIIAAQATEQGADFTDDDIYANVLTLLLAGEDTTANTIAWGCKYFIDFPDYFDRARTEVDELLGGSTSVTDYQQLSELPFIEAFTNETMRLKPIAPLNGLETNEPVELMGYHLPANTPVLAMTRYPALKAENFAEPRRFDPERWLKPSDDDQCPHNTQAFLPFGTGPRFCPGRNLALAEIKIVIAMLCRNFDLSLTHPDVVVEEKLSFTMLPKNLMVNFSPRG